MATTSDDTKKHQPTFEITEDQLIDLQKWVATLQQAFTLEAESGFNNLLGREEQFSSFITRMIASPPLIPIPEDLKSKLANLSDLFITYESIPQSKRRHLVVKSRKILHLIKRNLEPTSSIKPPKLRLSAAVELSSDRPLNSSKSINLSSPLSNVKGIGSKIAERFASVGLFLIKDLFVHYPRDYVDYSSLRRIGSLEVGTFATIVANVRRCNSFISPRNPNLAILELHLQDPTGRLKVTRFFAGRRFANQPYLKNQSCMYPPGALVAVSGLVRENQYGKSFQDPLIEVMENSTSVLKSKSIGRILPVYSLPEGISAERYRSIVENILPLSSLWVDPLPISRLKVLGLISRSEAMVGIHRPKTMASMKAARHRIVFDEFLLLQLGLLRRRLEVNRRPSPPIEVSWHSNGLVGRFLEMLPFSLTKAQVRVLRDIESDLVKSEPMSRLLQGDVGSGKTVIALAAILNAVEAGWQGALMAPTEVLANQHYRNLCKWLPELHVTVELLTGSTKRSKRRQLLTDLSNGSVKVLVGTHALIEEQVSFSRLGLVVVDEQHRFGVHQRNRLLSKGLQPHLLSMTATPIPRTLALSLHGDLDVSQIDELPPGRRPVKTRLISGSQRHIAYQLIRDEVNQGQRAYVILPLVEESEKVDLRSAVAVHSQLSEEIFPEFQVGLLHGRMKSTEKDIVIRKFVSGECQVLVSTTVVEVGVDVPEATVMLIDNADRFGLAQLHQLRGRVGRGASSSHCLLVNESNNALAKQRLEVLVRSNDGFEISEIDLRLRGPGQVLGTRQSGLPDFALANLLEDGQVLEQAREEAKYLLGIDGDLSNYPLLRIALNEYWTRMSKSAHLN